MNIRISVQADVSVFEKSGSSFLMVCNSGILLSFSLPSKGS